MQRFEELMAELKSLLLSLKHDSLTEAEKKQKQDRHYAVQNELVEWRQSMFLERSTARH